MYADKGGGVVEPKRYTYCFGDVIFLLKGNVYKGKRWGQIFGLFKHTYFMDRPIEQNIIKQRLRESKIMGVKLLPAIDPQIK